MPAPATPTAPGAADLAITWPGRTAQRLSLAEVRLLLRALLPLPVFDATAALDLLAYQRRRKLAAYCSHRRRTLRRLDELRRADLSL